MSKKYNKIEAKDNMKVEDDNGEEVVEKKKLDRIVDVKPKKRKKNLASRLLSGVLGPDGISGVGEYVNNEIVIPAVRNIIYSAIESTARMTIFGDKGGPPTPGRTVGSTVRRDNRPAINYSSVSRNENTGRTVVRSNRYGVEDFVIEDRSEAANVLHAVVEHADNYDSVSVADYYDLIGVPTRFTDNDYGWTIDTITSASIVPVRGGYVIKFPTVELL